MVTFARNCKLFASASAAPDNQGETEPIGANGPRDLCPKEHSLCMSDERTI